MCKFWIANGTFVDGTNTFLLSSEILERDKKLKPNFDKDSNPKRETIKLFK